MKEVFVKTWSSIHRQAPVLEANERTHLMNFEFEEITLKRGGSAIV